MIGVIAKYEGNVAVAVANSQAMAEQICLDMFERAGHCIDGVEVTIILFDPTDVGGLLLETDAIDMSGWSIDGYTFPD